MSDRHASPLAAAHSFTAAKTGTKSFMPIFVFSPWHLAGVGLGVAGLAYLILAVRSTLRFLERAVFGSGPRPGVSILKPLHGNHADLYERLRSFCVQDWPRYEVRAYGR